LFYFYLGNVFGFNPLLSVGVACLVLEVSLEILRVPGRLPTPGAILASLSLATRLLLPRFRNWYNFQLLKALSRHTTAGASCALPPTHPSEEYGRLESEYTLCTLSMYVAVTSMAHIFTVAGMNHIVSFNEVGRNRIPNP